jgi:hypothetical protein
VRCKVLPLNCQRPFAQSASILLIIWLLFCPAAGQADVSDKSV